MILLNPLPLNRQQVLSKRKEIWWFKVKMLRKKI
tara:strand:+ start:740 stop:841 length:102 start_codon:yes stop_codon:yes gene_type:complete